MSKYTAQEPLKIRPKEGVFLCMSIEFYDNENTLGQYPIGTNEDRKAAKRDERLAKKLKDQEELAALLAGDTDKETD